ncbi:MAG: acetolactate synthase small subunit [Wolinella sp.]
MESKRIISVTVINEHGVLSRISGLFAGRGYNIESLTVAPIPDSELSRITIATSGDSRVLEQIIKQLHKLIPVLTVVEHDEMIEKEMAMVKLPLESNLADLEALARAYHGEIVSATDKYVIIMAMDNPTRLTHFLAALKRFNPKDIVRSGIVAIERI